MSDRTARTKAWIAGTHGAWEVVAAGVRGGRLVPVELSIEEEQDGGFLLLKEPSGFLTADSWFPTLGEALAAAQEQFNLQPLDWAERHLERSRQAPAEVTASTPQELESALAEKLLRTFHLSVPERAGLVGGRMRFSALVSAAERVLAAGSCLPEGWAPNDEYDGVVLEIRDGAYWMHVRHEIGVLRFSPPRSKRVRSLREAVRRYLTHFGGGTSLDGIPIAWDE